MWSTFDSWVAKFRISQDFLFFLFFFLGLKTKGEMTNNKTEAVTDEGVAIAVIVVLLVVFLGICSYLLYAMNKTDPMEEETEKQLKRRIINGFYNQKRKSR